MGKSHMDEIPDKCITLPCENILLQEQNIIGKLQTDTYSYLGTIRCLFSVLPTVLVHIGAD